LHRQSGHWVCRPRDPLCIYWPTVQSPWSTRNIWSAVATAAGFSLLSGNHCRPDLLLQAGGRRFGASGPYRHVLAPLPEDRPPEERLRTILSHADTGEKARGGKPHSLFSPTCGTVHRRESNLFSPDQNGLQPEVQPRLRAILPSRGPAFPVFSTGRRTSGRKGRLPESRGRTCRERVR